MACFPFPPSLARYIRGMRNHSLDYPLPAAWKVVFVEGRIQPSTASRVRQMLQWGQGRSRTTVLSTEEKLSRWSSLLGEGEGRKQHPVCTSIAACPATQVTSPSRHQTWELTIRTRTRPLLLSCICLALICRCYLSLELLGKIPVCPYEAIPHPPAE